MTTLQYGDAAARDVSSRIATPVATTTVLQAVPANRRSDGQTVLVLADNTHWRFDANSTALASAGVLVPTAGTGRWIALSSGSTRSRSVRGVCYANMSISAFVGVAGGTAQDGITYVAGDRVLLANQTTAAENGIYMVGTVATGTAPLTRTTDWAAAAAIANGSVIEVSEGTLFAGSTWKAMCTGACVIATDDPLFYPRTCRGILTLASGTKTLGATEGLFLFSLTRSTIDAGFNTAGGTVTSTVGWRCASAGRTAGKSGTAALTIIAIVAAGTIDAANNSTMDWKVTNF